MLLSLELAQAGRQDVDVVSAGANEKLATDPKYAGPMNAFAIEALCRRLDMKNAIHVTLARQAHSHASRGLSSVQGQHFALIVFVDPRYAKKIDQWHITATRLESRRIRDKAYGAWRDAGFPKTLGNDKAQTVIRAYEKQTSELQDYAAYLARHVAPMIE